MQGSDNEATAVMERPTVGDTVSQSSPTKPGIEDVIPQDRPTGIAETDKVGPDNHRTRFQPGNQVWKRRQAADAKKNRQALRDALYKALTPDKMAKAVRRMLVIINGKDAKAAVAAFKVLIEAAGVRDQADPSKAGPSFTFILPGPGAIPEGPVDVREGQLRQTLPGPEVIDTTAEPQDV